MTILKPLVAATAFAAFCLAMPASASILTVTTWNNVPFYDYSPTETTIDQEIAYTAATTPDNVTTSSIDPAYYSWGVGGSNAVAFTGALNIATAGTYTFYVNADDAARISIDGVAVVENAFYGNANLLSPQTASIFLTAGSHAYSAFTFQEGGGQYYEATISGGPADVSFSPGPVPEPASWAMFIGGFGLVGGAMRRKKATVTFA